MAQDVAWGSAPRRVKPVATGVLVAAGFIFGLIPSAFAQSGGQPGQFMQFGVGGRAMAMGGAYYAISDDATAAYWNPAGLAQLQRKELTAMQATLFEQTKLTYVSYAHP